MSKSGAYTTPSLQVSQQVDTRSTHLMAAAWGVNQSFLRPALLSPPPPCICEPAPPFLHVLRLSLSGPAQLPSLLLSVCLSSPLGWTRLGQSTPKVARHEDHTVTHSARPSKKQQQQLLTERRRLVRLRRVAPLSLSQPPITVLIPPFYFVSYDTPPFLTQFSYFVFMLSLLHLFLFSFFSSPPYPLFFLSIVFPSWAALCPSLRCYIGGPLQHYNLGADAHRMQQASSGHARSSQTSQAPKDRPELQLL